MPSLCCRVGKFLSKIVNKTPNTRHFTKKITFLFVPRVSCTPFLMKNTHDRQIFPKNLLSARVSSKGAVIFNTGYKGGRIFKTNGKVCLTYSLYSIIFEAPFRNAENI